MTVLVTNPRERSRFLRFAMVGAIGAVVDFGVADLLDHYLHMPLAWAGTISFICAICSNFVWNRYWTYPDSRAKPILRQFFEFFLVSISGLFIRIPLILMLEKPMTALVSALPFTVPLMPAKLVGDNLTLAVAIAVVMFWNFFVNRYWTYNDVE
jgi:putative flippase GtrA